MELEEKGSVTLATNRGLGQGDAFGMASLSPNMFTASFAARLVSERQGNAQRRVARQRLCSDSPEPCHCGRTRQHAEHHTHWGTSQRGAHSGFPGSDGWPVFHGFYEVPPALQSYD